MIYLMIFFLALVQVFLLVIKDIVMMLGIAIMLFNVFAEFIII